MQQLQQQILDHYNKEGRDLPWRHTTDRYAIMVSEIMLQQTQVSRVIEKYNAWLEAFPTVQDLATASLKEVLTLWSGLGYNSRGKRLWQAAKIIVEKYNGIVPDTPEELIKLPGIGPYTARSILIFADNKDIATVDTNIRRILIHELKLDESTTDKELFTLAQELVPKGRSRDWHNALMDWGSTILTARKSGIKPKTTQSSFKHSRRFYRGRILKHLTIHDNITIAELEANFSDCPYEFKELLAELIDEGLLVKKGKKYIIAN